MATITANGWEVVSGTDGDDTIFTGGSGPNIIFAGDGVDTAQYFFSSNSYNIDISGDAVDVTWYLGDTDTFYDVERIEFNDKTVAVSPEAFQVYRLYQAALDRVPDIGGVSFWINHADHGTSIKTIANEFIRSNEFLSNYGDNTTNEQFIDLLYNNVLGREPDQGGDAYWNEQMDHGLDRADMLLAFADCDENIALTGAATHDGVWII